jgi:hypothetical protein
LESRGWGWMVMWFYGIGVVAFRVRVLVGFGENVHIFVHSFSGD